MGRLRPIILGLAGAIVAILATGTNARAQTDAFFGYSGRAYGAPNLSSGRIIRPGSSALTGSYATSGYYFGRGYVGPSASYSGYYTGGSYSGGSYYSGRLPSPPSAGYYSSYGSMPSYGGYYRSMPGGYFGRR